MENQMMPEPENYLVLMDERWAIEDLYHFPHAYARAYSFLYCFDSELNPRDDERINVALQEYPWRGGYSYANLYTVLRYQIPHAHRPSISAIRYESPGWIELQLGLDAAIQVAKAVGCLLAAGWAGIEAIKKIDKERLEIARQREKQRAELASFKSEEAAHLRRLADEVAKYTGFNSLKDLQRRTKNPETTLKLLMANYRRLKMLGEFVKSGKIQLPTEQIDRDDER